MVTPVRKQRRIVSAKVDQTKPASVIVNDKFNGLTHFCSLTGYPRATVHGWTIKGYIPPKYYRRCGAERQGLLIHSHILAVAKANRIKLLPSDFVEVAGVGATGDGAA